MAVTKQREAMSAKAKEEDMIEAKQRLERCATEEQTSLDLSGLELKADGAQEVARLVSNW